MKAYIKNLKEQTGTTDKTIALCHVCGSEYSANKGDYWFMSPDETLKCCGNTICDLVTKETRYISA